jgi:hypothetical protein
MHLPGNISAEDTTVAIHGITYDVISVKQVIAKRPTTEGGVSNTSLLLFLVTLAKNQKVPEIFKLTTLCNIVIKVEAYRTQNRLTQCNNCQRSGHIWGSSPS